MGRWAYAPLKTWGEYYSTLSATCSQHTNYGRWAGRDFAVPRGYKVLCSYPGTVIKAGWDNETGTGAFGYRVVVKHNNGFQTWYAHMTGNIQVKVGDTVKIGTVLGFVNNTGNSTGNHIHWAIKQNNTNIAYGWVCPENYVVMGISAGEYEEEEEDDHMEVNLSDLLTVETLGLDVSKWQPDFNFARAKSKCPNLKFVILKASGCDDDTGKWEAYQDPKFVRHYIAAKEAGLFVGAYHYIHPSVPIVEQVTTFVDAVRYREEIDLPLMLDFEKTWSSPKENKQNLIAFINLLMKQAKEKNVNYSDAYKAWWAKNYAYMMTNYSSKGWNSGDDHHLYNWPGMYTRGNIWKDVNIEGANWEFLCLWTAQYIGVTLPTIYNPWLSKATWHIHQMGQGKQQDFGAEVDVNQWNPAVPFLEEVEPPPPPTGDVSVKLLNDVTVETEVNGVKLRGTLKLNGMSIDLEEVS